MRAALVVNRVLPDAGANLSAILQLTGQAAAHEVDLVLFPEAALTGLINDDDPAHDLPLGEPIPGPALVPLAAAARRWGVWLAIGLLEREADHLFDSAVLIAPTGALALTYRRIHPGWHGPCADPAVYRQGTRITAAPTPFGTVAFLICGDLFDDDLVQQVRDLAPGWLLFPFGRSFDDGSHDGVRWEREELPAYVRRVEKVGVTTLMVNYLADASLPGDTSFGGAAVVSAAGNVIAAFPTGRQGILFVELSVTGGADP